MNKAPHSPKNPKSPFIKTTSLKEINSTHFLFFQGFLNISLIFFIGGVFEVRLALCLLLIFAAFGKENKRAVIPKSLRVSRETFFHQKTFFQIQLDQSQ